MTATVQRIDELDGAPVLGRYYLVPCVEYVGLWWPTIGGWHEDAEILKFKNHHFHYDFRFINRRHLNLLRSNPNKPHRRLPEYMGLVHSGPVQTPPLEHMRMRCNRLTPDFPTYTYRAGGWGEKLENAHAEHVLKPDCAVCPHRGFKLGNLPQSADGVVVCPGHGLAWHLPTGRLVKRTPTITRHPARDSQSSSLQHSPLTPLTSP